MRMKKTKRALCMLINIEGNENNHEAGRELTEAENSNPLPDAFNSIAMG